MQLILHNQSQNASRHRQVTENDNVLYSDNYCILEIEAKERELAGFHQANGKICLIFGTISLQGEEIAGSNNPAVVFLRDYVDNPEAFLLISEGNFLLIEYDINTQSLTVYRDILGLRHAYYTTTSEGFCLSTSIAPVLKFRKKENTNISSEGLGLYLAFQYLPQPYTLFTNISQLPLNKKLLYANKAVAIINNKRSYVDMLRYSIGNDANDVETILATSLKRQLNTTNYKVGAFLSGGMDTSSNIAILASNLGVYPVVFTAGFTEQEYDETPYAKIMAKKYGFEHVILTITPEAMLDLPKISSLFDNPIADRAIIPEYAICQKAKEMGITHMVTGEGGDEVLGYPRNLPENIKFTRNMLANKALSDYYYSISALMSEDLRKKILINKDFSNNYLYDLYRGLGSMHPFEKIYYGQWQTWMIDNVLMKDTQLFKGASLRFISPYMDMRLMKYCMSFSAEQKMKLFRNKNYLKNKLSGLLPETIINKSKHKFHVPIAEWLRAELYEQAYDMLLAKDSVCDSFMDKKIIRRMLEDHKQGKADYNRPLWGLLFLENWYKMKKRYL